jgi:hypothetical protein
MLSETPARKVRWWIVPLVLAVLTIGYLCWYFAQNSAIGNQLLTPVKTSHGS